MNTFVRTVTPRFSLILASQVPRCQDWYHGVVITIDAITTHTSGISAAKTHTHRQSSRLVDSCIANNFFAGDNRIVAVRKKSVPSLSNRSWFRWICKEEIVSSEGIKTGRSRAIRLEVK